MKRLLVLTTLALLSFNSYALKISKSTVNCILEEGHMEIVVKESKDERISVALYDLNLDFTRAKLMYKSPKLTYNDSTKTYQSKSGAINFQFYKSKVQNYGAEFEVESIDFYSDMFSCENF
ncbi:hypothetical protein BIY24_15155 [Halobacteriovorax marinus]|uniref:hypothetical protein n=1 Tax=Halobacteriovorax marinus TaxID=97084 RepID=UPI000BC35DD0|nr:hypothetical protein [Halobacteriovorax marinus]ATH09232.1 hypothetical protein BIY24_15155 [Halobacteriovorax marinus]